MSRINRSNLVEKASALRESGSFQSYLSYWSKQCAPVLSVVANISPDPILTAKDALDFAKFCQKLWSALPDCMDIRTGPFFQICDFAEYSCSGWYEEEDSPHIG